MILWNIFFLFPCFEITKKHFSIRLPTVLQVCLMISPINPSPKIFQIEFSWYLVHLLKILLLRSRVSSANFPFFFPASLLAAVYINIHNACIIWNPTLSKCQGTRIAFVNSEGSGNPRNIFMKCCKKENYLIALRGIILKSESDG